MKFIHLKAQIVIQEAESKARRIINEIAEFCRKVGGNFHFKETPVSYIASCMLPTKTHIMADMWSQKDYMEITVDTWTLRLHDVPKEKRFSFGVISFREEKVTPPYGGTASGVISPKSSSAHGHVIADSFTVVVDKDYKTIHINIPSL